MAFGLEESLHEVPIENLIFAISISVVLSYEIHITDPMLLPLILPELRGYEPRPVCI